MEAISSEVFCLSFLQCVAALEVFCIGINSDTISSIDMNQTQIRKSQEKERKKRQKRAFDGFLFIKGEKYINMQSYREINKLAPI